MNPIGRITWSDPGCLDANHRHRSVAERRECVSTPRIAIYDGRGDFVTLIDHPEDLLYMYGVVITALKQISVEQARRKPA